MDGAVFAQAYGRKYGVLTVLSGESASGEALLPYRLGRSGIFGGLLKVRVSRVSGYVCLSCLFTGAERSRLLRRLSNFFCYRRRAAVLAIDDLVSVLGMFGIVLILFRRVFSGSFIVLSGEADLRDLWLTSAL